MPMRTSRAIWHGTVRFRMARTSRAMTNERRCHDVYVTTLAPIGLDRTAHAHSERDGRRMSAPLRSMLSKAVTQR